jgi:UrcA family protein
MFKTLILGCALAALTVSAASAAEPVRTAVVRYGDLNVASASGWQTLHQRLSLAAQQVCDEPGAGAFDPRAHKRVRTCRREAIASAARAVSPQMASVDPRYAY